VIDSGNRALAAQALLRMADCYQKLGDREAQAIYDRVVRDYSDQKDAVAIARLRLGPAAAAVRRTTDRPVWTGPDADGFGTISRDGRIFDVYRLEQRRSPRFARSGSGIGPAIDRQRSGIHAVLRDLEGLEGKWSTNGSSAAAMGRRSFE
jgi:hypothetical protein